MGTNALSPEAAAEVTAAGDIDLSRQMDDSSCCWQWRGLAWRLALSLWLQRTEYFWRNPIADARFQTVTDFDGIGAGRGGVARRSFRGISVGPGRTDGRLGHAGRFGRVPQPDPWERS